MMTTFFLKANRIACCGFICLALLSYTTIAQNEPESPKMRERMEAYKIAYITERLELTPKEATTFWPVYNEFEKQMRDLKRSQRELSRSFNQSEPMSDKEADKYLSTMIELKQKEHELVKKYIPEFKKILSVQKVALLMATQEDFKMHLMRRMHEHMSPDKKTGQRNPPVTK